MIVTPASIKALMTSFRKDFQGGLDGAPSQYPKIAMTVPSSSKSNTYGWLGNAPQLREWVGARVVKQMAAHGYVIDNKTYEGTVGISAMILRMTISVSTVRCLLNWGVLRPYNLMNLSLHC